MSTQTNGRIRKSLAEQIDRLDAVIDALGDGLTEAVASAVKQAVGDVVRQTVQTLLAELTSNPEVMARLHEAIAPPIQQPTTSNETNTTTKPKLAERMWAWVCERLNAVRQGCQEVRRQVVETTSRWGSSVLATMQTVSRTVLPFRRQILFAASVGVVGAVIAYCTGPYVAAGAGWIGGFVTTLAVQAGIALKKLLNGEQGAQD